MKSKCCITGWWFQRGLIFTPIWIFGEDFPDGLKPPTSNLFLLVLVGGVVLKSPFLGNRYLEKLLPFPGKNGCKTLVVDMFVHFSGM